MTLEEWADAVCAQLGLDPAEGRAALPLTLDLAREAAHAVMRPAAPVTTYLLGLAVARGADPAVAAAGLTALARGQSTAAE